MAWTIIDHNSFNSATDTSLTINSSQSGGADLIVAVVAYLGGSNISPAQPITDNLNANGSWTFFNSNNNSYNFTPSGDPSIQIGYLSNPTTGASHTFTSATSNGFPGLTVVAFKGSQTSSSPFDNVGTGHQTTSGTTSQVTSIPNTVSNELSLAVYGGYGSYANLSIDLGFTKIDGSNNTNGYSTSIAYLVTNAAQSPTWTQTASVTRMVAWGISFLPGTGTPPSTTVEWRSPVMALPPGYNKTIITI